MSDIGTQICTKCKKSLPITEYNWKSKGVKRSLHCKACSRQYVRNHYKNNRNYYLNKTKRRNIKLRHDTYEYLGNYLLTHVCVDCGENDVLVLEFDHKDRLKKDLEINKMIRKRLSLDTLKKEVQKCDVRCANCHRRKTSIESNSWRLKFNKHP